MPIAHARVDLNADGIKIGPVKTDAQGVVRVTAPKGAAARFTLYPKNASAISGTVVLKGSEARIEVKPDNVVAGWPPDLPGLADAADGPARAASTAISAMTAEPRLLIVLFAISPSLSRQ